MSELLINVYYNLDGTCAEAVLFNSYYFTGVPSYFNCTAAVPYFAIEMLFTKECTFVNTNNFFPIIFKS